MKTTKILSAAALIVCAVCSMGAKRLQCGVSNADIASYLQNCSHHHTVYSVWDIPGTCNSNASIENCKIATVYVSDGIIIYHVDASGICE